MAQNFKKIGRNDPCPCGSGRKFKHCCESQVLAPTAQAQALEFQRVMQQGHGQPIRSESIQGKRIVEVGGRLFVSDRWKTFHDFLQFYIKTVLEPAWGNAELKKPEKERHPLMNWYRAGTAYVNRHIVADGQVSAMPATGQVAAYLGLAYNLYLLSHNRKVHDTLIRRLKQKDQFYGAYYEAFVIGALIRANFDVEFEDESDSTTSHCELTATYKPTGEKFSVEAKMRGAGKQALGVGDQLYKALRKKAEHTRIVFIEVNVEGDGTRSKQEAILTQVLTSIRAKEATLTVDGQPAPAAYVIATNNPHGMTDCLHEASAMAEGFKIPDFKVEGTYADLASALAARARHQAVTALLKSLGEHGAPPATFDGEVAPSAFNSIESRLRIGSRYVVPTDSGEAEGELTDATVDVNSRKAFGAVRLDDGRTVMVGFPLSDVEMAAYHASPRTFFGVLKDESKAASVLDLYDQVYNCYKQSSKEQLLKFLAGSADMNHLTTWSQEELARIYAERVTYDMLREAGKRLPPA